MTSISIRTPCPSKAMRADFRKRRLASPEAQRFIQQAEAWARTTDRLPTHYITINLLRDGPLADFKGTAGGRRERLFSDLRRKFRKYRDASGRPVAWRHIWVMERGKIPTYFPHVNLLIWLPKDAAFRRLLWAYLVHRFSVTVPAGKRPWDVLKQTGKRHPVCVRPISDKIGNRATGRAGLNGLVDYLVKEIDANAFEHGMKLRLGDLVGASSEIIKLHRAANFSRPRLRLRKPPLFSCPPAPPAVLVLP